MICLSQYSLCLTPSIINLNTPLAKYHQYPGPQGLPRSTRSNFSTVNCKVPLTKGMLQPTSVSPKFSDLSWSAESHGKDPVSLIFQTPSPIAFCDTLSSKKKAKSFPFLLPPHTYVDWVWCWERGTIYIDSTIVPWSSDVSCPGVFPVLNA